MSLINEALKRTRDASYQSVQGPPATPTSYRVERTNESRGSKSTLFVTALAAVMTLGGIIVLGWHISTGMKKLNKSFAEVESAPVVTVPTVTPATVEAPVREQPPSTPAVDSKPTEEQLVTRVMEKIKAEQAPAPVIPPPPKLALQGITYAADGSEAMINGVSLREGEEVEGARVISIERRLVRLDFGGRELVLRLY